MCIRDRATGSLPTRPVPPEQARVYLCAGVVVKIHAEHADPSALTRRLHLMAGPDTEPCWAQPLLYRPFVAPGGRVGTLWPRVTVLSSIDRPPWAEAAALLARLHRAVLRGDPGTEGGAYLTKTMLSAAVFGVVAWLSGGPAGPGRLSVTGPPPHLAAAALAVEVALGAAAVMLVRRGAPAVADAFAARRDGYRRGS